MNKTAFVTILILLVATNCSPGNVSRTPQPPLFPSTQAVTTPIPAATPTAIVFPSPTVPNPLHLTMLQLLPLGVPNEPFVPKRQIVIQRFDRGVMLIFAKANDAFDKTGGEFIFALVNDGRAWRVKDTFIETSKNPDDWYTCERKPGLRPERSGIPWRGFGKAWCEHSEVREALGAAKSYEENDLEAAFQVYEKGRAIQVFDWKGFKGWENNRVYVVYYYSLTDPDFVVGRWE